jgi:hypothetical protein
MVTRHLWLALSPHGYGHAAMTAPVIEELRRRRPNNLRLTIQTALPREFLATRYGDDFTHVAEIPDFGLRMTSATGIAMDETARDYLGLHADWPRAVESEAARLRAARPDAVLANVPYVTIAAAALAGIPVAAFSSLEWADIYLHYFGDRPEGARIGAQMAEAYNSARVFLQVTPAMAMPSLRNLRTVGPVARRGHVQTAELRRRLGVAEAVRIGLIAFGGIDHAIDLAAVPCLPGWVWLTTLALPPGRPDFRRWEEGGMSFTDLIASVAVVVTKPGYGTFTEAGLAGTPVLYLARPDWPESPNLDDWLAAHTRAAVIAPADLLSERLSGQLQAVFSLPNPPPADPTGIIEAASAVEALLDGEGVDCGRS